MFSILEIIQGGEVKPTRIMHRANLSYEILKEALDKLLSQGLISEVDTTLKRRRRDKRTNRIYEITKKGQNVIRYTQNARRFLKFEKQVYPTNIL